MGFTAGKTAHFTVATANAGGRLSERGVLPSGLTFRPTSRGQATISGIPAAGSGGVYPMTVAVPGTAGKQVTQKLAITIDEAPQIVTGKTAQWGAVFGHLTFRVTATGYPVPHLAIAGKLPPGLTFAASGRTAVISGRLRLSWLKTLLAAAEIGGAVALAILTGGTSLVAEFGVVARAGSAGYSTLYAHPTVTLIASNSLGARAQILTMRILGPS
jgi:hypothetical protein